MKQTLPEGPAVLSHECAHPLPELSTDQASLAPSQAVIFWGECSKDGRVEGKENKKIQKLTRKQMKYGTTSSWVTDTLLDTVKQNKYASMQRKSVLHIYSKWKI